MSTGYTKAATTPLSNSEREIVHNYRDLCMNPSSRTNCC
jgi:hypothetical protein